MAKAKIEFKKGDGITHTFLIPADQWSSGGKLFFAAKSVPDNDSTDSVAVIDKSFTDSVVTDTTVSGTAYKVYTLTFVAADTADVNFSDGSKKKRYLGEFQFVPATGEPTTIPGSDDFLDVIVYADIKRGTT